MELVTIAKQKQELQNLVTDEVKTLLEQAKEFTFIPLEDIDSEKKADGIRKQLKTKYRLPISRKAKEFTETAKKFIQEISETEQMLVHPILAEEKRLENMTKANKLDRKRIKEEKERAIIERFNSRTSWLLDMGAGFNGTIYQLRNLAVTTERITNASEEDWKVICEKISKQAEAIRKEEEAKKAALEQIERENEELKARLAALEGKEEPNKPETKPEPADDRGGEPKKIDSVLDKVLEKVKHAEVDAPKFFPRKKDIMITEGANAGPLTYDHGFNICKSKVLDILHENNVDKNIISLIRQLKP